jgi:hypothetical protein
VDPVNDTDADVISSPDDVKWNPAELAQFVSDTRCVTIPASDDTVVTVPMFHVPP